MIKLNAPVWQTLSSAGNDAEKWLLALTEGNGNTRETIEILAEDWSHQLSWYPATAYTLPHIAAFCPKLSKEDKVFLIAQMGAAIATEAMAPLSPESEAYHEFHEGLDGLRKETEALLTDAEVHALLKADAELGTMFSLGALAIIGNRAHAYALWYLSGSTWEEAPAACPCGWEDETLPLAEQPDPLEPIEILPWDKKSLDNEAVWLNGLLELAGDDLIRPILPLVYGTGTCPDCGKQEPYWDWFCRFHC